MADDMYDVQEKQLEVKETKLKVDSFMRLVGMMMALYMVAGAGATLIIIFLGLDGNDLLPWLTGTATLIIGYAFGAYKNQ